VPLLVLGNKQDIQDVASEK